MVVVDNDCVLTRRCLRGAGRGGRSLGRAVLVAVAPLVPDHNVRVGVHLSADLY